MLRLRQLASVSAVLISLSAYVSAQGLRTTATREDWEDVNFVFGSSTLTDAYPALIHAAEVLKQNPKYSATLKGYTDAVGPVHVNLALAEARVSAVKAFLVDRGAQPGQVRTAAIGPRQALVPNETPEGRFMNRRVTVSVADELGRLVSPMSLGSRIRPLNRRPAAPPAVPKPVAGTGAGACYGVQVGAFRDAGGAERTAKALRKVNPEVRLLPTGTAPALLRVVLGCEASKEGAQALVQRLLSVSPEAFIVVTARVAGSASGAALTAAR